MVKSLLLGNLRVHIAPVGDDDKRRIILPIERFKADKVYLITKEGKDQFKENVNEIEKELLSKKIISKENLKVCKIDIYNFTDIQTLLAKIYSKEIENDIFYNASTGGKLLATAGYLACLLFNGIAYYCKKDYELNIISDNPDIFPIPDYYISRPSEELILFLIFFKELQNFFKLKSIPKRFLLEIMGVIKDQNMNASSGEYNSLNALYLDHLIRFNYIDVSTGRPKKVKLLEKGRNAIKIFNAYYQLTSKVNFELKKKRLLSKISPKMKKIGENKKIFLKMNQKSD